MLDDGEVEDVLTSTSSTNALSANMGRVLKNLIDDLEARVNAFEASNTKLRQWT
jgi:hypothetical protein